MHQHIPDVPTSMLQCLLSLPSSYNSDAIIDTRFVPNQSTIFESLIAVSVSTFNALQHIHNVTPQVQIEDLLRVCQILHAAATYTYRYPTPAVCMSIYIRHRIRYVFLHHHTYHTIKDIAASSPPDPISWRIDPLVPYPHYHIHAYIAECTVPVLAYIEASSPNWFYACIDSHDTRDARLRDCMLHQRCIHTLICIFIRV